MKDLLIEIGTEEIPAGFLINLTKNLPETFSVFLDDNLVEYKDVKVFATPRRITVITSNVNEMQKLEKYKIKGPPVKICYDENNKSSKALESFLNKNGADVKDLVEEDSPKGKYVCIYKEKGGEKVEEILPEIVKEFILSIKFKKTMVWESSKFRFARPVRWFVVIFGDKSINFNLAGIDSGNLSYGHRFLGDKFKISDISKYQLLLEEQKVIVDQNRRKEMIKTQLEKFNNKVKGNINIDESLLNEVTFLVEYPKVVQGSIDKRYMVLPPDVIITSAEHHQKYFTIYGENGELLPYFYTVSNMPINDVSKIIKGNERVLKARLEDALFFFQEDMKKPLIDRLDELKTVTYQKKLGSIYDKVVRTGKIAVKLNEFLGYANSEKVDRAVKLMKNDLITDMVYEFPELQGIMGKEYAKRQNEDSEVADAILEHYLPKFSGDILPDGATGTIVSLADKFDTIVSGISAGLKHTGNQDPYAIRRAAIGILSIVLEKQITIDMFSLIEFALSILPENMKTDEKIAKEIIEFFKIRFENIAVDRGFSKGVIKAVTENNFNNPYIDYKKIQAISSFTNDENFKNLSVLFKRVVNIIKNRDKQSFDSSLLRDDAEKKLWSEFQSRKSLIEDAIDKEDFIQGMTEVIKLKSYIDNFFDEVLVMAEDESLRNNRIAILQNISDEIKKIGDFSLVS